jgi:hypothetical protein
MEATGFSETFYLSTELPGITLEKGDILKLTAVGKSNLIYSSKDNMSL